jgi:hypothetical protein
MRYFAALLLGGLLLLALGCGGGESGLLPASGTVTLDGGPLAGALVMFIPEGDTKGQGGSATTGADGRYEVKSAKGGNGLQPGSYRVTVSKRLLPDGSPAPADVPPIESNARETLPRTYSDPSQTTLKLRVEVGKSLDLPLRSGKKP